MDETNENTVARPAAIHARAQSGAMLHSESAAFARAIVKLWDEWYTLLRRTIKVRFAGVQGEFVPVGRLAKRGAINGTTYIFARKIGDGGTLYVYDWSQCGGIVPVSMEATSGAEREACKLLAEIEYPSEAYEAAGFRAPALRAEDRDASGKPLDEKVLRKNRAERMSERLETLLSIAVPIPSLAEG
jgi:hypothetical protein